MLDFTAVYQPLFVGEISDRLLYTTITCLLCNLVFLFLTYLPPVLYGIVRRYVHGSPSIKPGTSVSVQRTLISARDFKIDGHALNRQNVHKYAARRRTAARHWMETSIRADLGKKPFALNLSNSDLRKGSDGSRLIRTIKDHAYYGKSSHVQPNPTHAFSAVDDLDYYDPLQLSHLLAKSKELDAPIYSFMHQPTAAAFRSDEFLVNYDFDDDRWHFQCADEGTYVQELWDNSVEMVSHWGFTSLSLLQYAFAFCLATALALTYYVHSHNLLDVPHSSFGLPFVGKFCYAWYATEFSYLSYGFVKMTKFVLWHHNDYRITVDLARLIAEHWPFDADPISHVLTLRFDVFEFTYPWSIDCPVQTWAPLIIAVWLWFCLFVLITLTIRATNLHSGFHFCFHVPAERNRTIWIMLPAVRFGIIKTLFYRQDIIDALPRRLRPTLVEIPPTDLEPHGTKIAAFFHVNQQTHELNYSYTINKTGATTIMNTKGYNIIKSWNMTRQKALSVSQFQSTYKEENDWTSDQIMIAIAAITHEAGHTRAVQYTRPASTYHYRFKPDTFEEFQPKMGDFFQGMTRGCTYVPLKTRANTEHGVRTRITEVAPNMPDHLTVYQERCLNHFLKSYAADVPDARRYRMSHEEVFELQSKPGQRRTNTEAYEISDEDWFFHSAWNGKQTESFQKTEAGMKAGDPRNITPMPPKVRFENSRISLALAANCKKTKWYAFGCTPAQVAQRVSEHVADPVTKEIFLGDYSRMDGTVNSLIRKFDLAFLHANFHPSEHADVDNWYELTYGNSVKAGHGVWYEQGESQASGDPYTSVLNTARNAFISYICLLQNLTPAGAYANLGLMAGDDSIQRNVQLARSTEIAASWGFKLTGEIRQRGESVDFLARHYDPCVWFGSCANICSPLRMISKFHVSSLVGKIPSDVIAYMKASSILSNDSETLIVGDYMRMIVEQTREAFQNWNARASPNKQREALVLQQWNDKWARSRGDVAETSYQANQVEEDFEWHRELFAREFDPESVDDFEVWLATPGMRWDSCPVLLEREAIPRDVPYLANEVLVESSPPALEVDTDAAPNSEAAEHFVGPDEGPKFDRAVEEKTKIHSQDSPSRESATVCHDDAKTWRTKARKSTPNKSTTVKRCKRGDSCGGWYAGLAPCHEKVAGGKDYCRDCHSIYVKAIAARKSK